MDEPTQLQLSVKSAFRLLVTACDGPTNAARICDAQASHISEASSPNWPRHPRADHIRAMELYLGKPVFTREAAAVMGYELTPTKSVSSPETVHEAALHVVRQIAALQVAMAEAQADGRLDAPERKRIRELLQRLIAEAHDLDTALAEGQ